ncbi:TIGR03086 family metal-binding protein [Acrocarpospora macrocephala]|uniref:TIGR03086 family protein n=1 Tax=Acrocarpospora macrocephala TaxID=150177 RepID=A0A5M3WHN5_9ACTN|nr:TIGR03086 family metal-binding protein [Acrocarpospora macrocephala]GES06641.1 TIGR03086 family protein [Acrocarpospora macrocephala]
MNPDPIIGLLERDFDTTTALLASVQADGWAKASPCAGWTVRQVGNHLVGGLALVARIASGGSATPEEADPQRAADIDHLGAEPAKAFAAVAERCLAAFAAPGALERAFPFQPDPVPGVVLVNVCLLESLVHGWDIAYGTGTSVKPEDTVVDAVAAFSYQTIGAERRTNGQFGPALPTGPADPPFTALLAHLGRRA